MSDAPPAAEAIPRTADSPADAETLSTLDIGAMLVNDAGTSRFDTHELTYTDVTGAERSVRIEVRRPAVNRTTSPVVVWSHGGSTGKTSPAKVGDQWGRAMNQADFVFVAIAHAGRTDESRRALCAALDIDSCGEFKYLLWDRLRDAQTAFDWLEGAARDGELFVDLDRLVYGGHSAGALAVMVMAGMDSPYASGVPMPIDERPAAFLVASPPGVDTNGLTAASVERLDRPMLMLTGEGDTTGGTTGQDRLALFDLIDADQVMLVTTDSDEVGHTTFDFNTGPCLRAGGSASGCRETVRTLGKTAQAFLRAAFVTGGLDAAALVAASEGRLPDHIELRIAAD